MKKVLLLCLIVTLLFTITSCGSKKSDRVITHTVTENGTENGTKQEIESGDFSQECTIDNVTFYVDENWLPMSGQDGAFVTPDNKVAYMVLGVTPLYSFTPEEFYENLIKEYESKYEVTKKDDALSAFVTADSIDAMIGNVEMTVNNSSAFVDILIVPQKNIVVTFSAQCAIGNELPVDIRRVTETATFDIGTKDYVSGNQFRASDGSELCLLDDGTFMYYMDTDDHDLGYVTGTYKIYYGQEAIDAIAGMSEYGLSEEELESVIANDMNGYIPGGKSIFQYFSDDEGDTSEEGYHVCKDTFYAMEIYNKEMVQGDQVTEAAGNRVLFLGYYLPELEMMDMLNANTTNYTQWKLKKD